MVSYLIPSNPKFKQTVRTLSALSILSPTSNPRNSSTYQCYAFIQSDLCNHETQMSSFITTVTCFSHRQYYLGVGGWGSGTLWGIPHTPIQIEDWVGESEWYATPLLPLPWPSTSQIIPPTVFLTTSSHLDRCPLLFHKVCHRNLQDSGTLSSLWDPYSLGAGRPTVGHPYKHLEPH